MHVIADRPVATDRRYFPLVIHLNSGLLSPLSVDQSGVENIRLSRRISLTYWHEIQTISSLFTSTGCRYAGLRYLSTTSIDLHFWFSSFNYSSSFLVWYFISLAMMWISWFQSIHCWCVLAFVTFSILRRCKMCFSGTICKLFVEVQNGNSVIDWLQFVIVWLVVPPVQCKPR